jgi:ketosteroid isomerase-like protein
MTGARVRYPALALVALVALGLAACPGDPQRDHRADADELRQLYTDAYNRHDAAAVAELYTDDAIVANTDGSEVRGRAAIREMFERSFQQRPVLGASPVEVGGHGDLGWEYGSFTIQLGATTMVGPQQPGAQPQPGAPPQPGVQPQQPAPQGRDPGPAEGPPTDTRPLDTRQVEPEQVQPGAQGQAQQPQQQQDTLPVPRPGVDAPALQQPGGVPPAGVVPQPVEGRYLLVLERRQDRWLIRAHTLAAAQAR